MAFLRSAPLVRRLVAPASGRKMLSATETLGSVDGPYTKPDMVTEIPGPNSRELIKEMGSMMEARTVMFFTDLSKSQGNYVVDADGNVLLDVFTSISSLPLGYNNQAVRDAVKKEENLDTLVTRPALGVLPPKDYLERVKRTFLSMAPTGLECVTQMMCGTCSNENAFKAAMIQYMDKRRGSKTLPPNSAEFSSALVNKPPGSPKLSVLSFMGGFHGRCFGSLSATHSSPIHKLDIPAFDWPVAPFPQLRYPLEEFERENRQEEEKCLEQAEDLIHKYNKKEQSVVGMIVEPVQGEGGDNHATAFFFKGLQQICKRHDMSFIVDEVQTGGGASGKMWFHDWWGLQEPPDFVTFAKKFQSGGYFHRHESIPPQSYRIFNTWLGDPMRLVVLETVLEQIEQLDLLPNATVTGDRLLAGLKSIESRHPDILMKTRGRGTFCAVDCKDTDTRNKIVAEMRNGGVSVGGSGERAIRLRPSLVFQPHHVDIFLDVMEKAVNKISARLS